MLVLGEQNFASCGTDMSKKFNLTHQKKEADLDRSVMAAGSAMDRNWDLTPILETKVIVHPQKSKGWSSYTIFYIICLCLIEIVHQLMWHYR